MDKVQSEARDEAIDIRRVALQLSDTAFNAPEDLVNNEVRLYDVADPSTLIGIAVFINGGDTATSSALSKFFVPMVKCD